MGKVLIIKGADFSVNAIGQIDPPTPPTPGSHNYIQFKLLTGNTVAACYNGTIEVGKKVGFAKSSMWTKYKMAISLSGYFPGKSTWDTQYSGNPYIQNNVTILTQAVQIMIVATDGLSMTEEKLAELNNNIFYIDD